MRALPGTSTLGSWSQRSPPSRSAPTSCSRATPPMRPTSSCSTISHDERDALFTFLTIPGVAATNHRAEQALRPAVVNRKAWGGNMTWAGADTQQVLASVLRTSRQQGRDPVDILVPLLVSATPAMADLAIPGRAPPDPARSRHA